MEHLRLKGAKKTKNRSKNYFFAILNNVINYPERCSKNMRYNTI